MANIKELEKENGQPQEPSKGYTPEGDELIVRTYVDQRVVEMKEHRKTLKVEERWKEADQEYVPSELGIEGQGRKRLEAIDQDLGRRSRLVPVGDSSQAWRSDNSDPTLLVKIQSALSIIIDRNPEAILSALTKRYEKATTTAYGLWKRNWEISQSKEVLKKFAFNLIKYGWAVARSHPKLVKFDKQILTEIDTENPENNVYESKELIWYNDVAKQNLDPYRTWIDEMTEVYDRYSMNDCYYEIDYSYDAAQVEFGQYPNWKEYVKRGGNQLTDPDGKKEEGDKSRKDIVTIGCYENRLKDLYVIYLPAKKIVLYHSPLPNDDGLLSLWHSLWILRDAKSPYGVSLWEIIKQDKALYDKMKNMNMDQLVLSIMKMFFYTGTSNLLGDGKIHISPGKGEQVLNGDIKWMEVPGPGNEAWQGLQYQKALIDDNSGITPTLEGQVTGKDTLGAILHAKESALKRLKVPIENIAEAIEQDAYLSLSWMKQIYSTPEVMEFGTTTELREFEEETGLEHTQLYQNVDEETGEPGALTGTFLPQLALHLEDRDGQLYESKESRFFQIGKDLNLKNLDWKGIFRVVPKSILAPSAELEKQRKNELFNLLMPLLGGDPAIYLKPVMQILKSNDESPEDWLPDSWLNPPQESLFVDQVGEMMAKAEAAGGSQTMQGKAGTGPVGGTPKVVPGNQMMSPMGGKGGIRNINKGLTQQ